MLIKLKKDIGIKYEMDLNNKLRDLPDFITDYIESLENNTSIRTRIAYCKDLSIYLRFLLNELKKASVGAIVDLTIEDINDITEKDIRMFLKYLTMYTVEYISTGGKLVKQTYKNEEQGKSRKIAALRSFYAYTCRVYNDNVDIINQGKMDEDKIPKLIDPTKYIDIKMNEKVEIKNSLNGVEIDKLVETVLGDLSGSSEREKLFHQKLQYRNANIILLFAYTGIRVSELANLDYTDINTEEGIFVVSRKGGDQEILYLSEEIIPYLRDYIEDRKLVLDVNIECKNALFISSRKSRLSTRQIAEIISKYSSKAGLDDITPHTLRRSFGMALYNQTKDIQLTADVLGHSTTETTRKFYAKPEEARKQKTLKNFIY